MNELDLHFYPVIYSTFSPSTSGMQVMPFQTLKLSSHKFLCWPKIQILAAALITMMIVLKVMIMIMDHDDNKYVIITMIFIMIMFIIVTITVLIKLYNYDENQPFF